MDSFLSEYELGERISQSTRTIVYRAHRRLDHSPCIIKVQQREHSTPAELDRLRREFEIAKSLDIEGVIRAFALARYKSRVALIMEDFGAVSLSTLIAQKRFTLDEILTIGVQLASTLARIHQRHVVHKDVNPSNVVINPETQQVKLIDFDISTTLSRERPSINSPNLLEGTLRYISPEQTGRMNRAIDYRTDFYSLGATLYELLAGAPPFESQDPLELIHCHIALAPPPLHQLRPEIPRPVCDIVMKLLAKTAEERYQSGQGIAEDLAECRAQLRASGQVDTFLLGRHDASDRLQIPQKLYGREADSQAMHAAFERICQGTRELILVTGYSGMGKSALVHEIHKSLVQSRGYFASGKFDPLKRNIPYASLIEAFQELIRQLLAESEEQLALWRKKLEDALGPNASVIAEVIPAVELIVGKLPPAPQLAAAQSQNRFHFVFQRFVRTLSSPEHPLVLFLDDLQWADAPSRDLIHVLMTDPELRHLCIIGAYRDNEVDPTHPLSITLDAIQRAGTPVTTLRLKPLELADTLQLLDDTFHCGRERAEPLAALLLRRTEGNPFFLNQLLGALFDERVIEFDSDAGEWRWDLDAIRARGLTGGIVEFMAAKIQKLPAATQQALKLAACIGTCFDLQTLSILERRSPAETAAGFWDALTEGLLLPVGDAYHVAAPARLAELGGEAPSASFKFLHDRVHQAAYSLIEEDQRKAIHAELGGLLLASTPPEKLDERIVDIVNQFVLGLERISSPEERYEVARLSLMAGQKAKASAAFEPALRYYMTGIQLLPEGAFDERHELAFALHIEGSEAEYLNANMERAEALALVAMAHARTVLEKVKVAETRILFSLSRNQLEETLRIGLEALEMLGVRLPFDATPEHVQSALARDRTLLADRELEELIDLPECTTPEQLAAQRILAHLSSPSFVINPHLYMLIASEQFYLTVRHGNSRYAPGSYVKYGGLHATMLKDLDTATGYGDVARRVMERLNAREAKAEVHLLLSAFIRSWKVHIRETFDLLREGMQAGIETGDLQYAHRCGSHLGHSSVVGGEPLEPLFETVTRVVEFHTRHKQTFLRLYSSIIRQWAHNLLGHGRDPLMLKGECFDEDESLPEVLAKNFTSAGVFYALKAMLAYLFGDYGKAVEWANRTESYEQALVGLPTSVLANLYQSLPLLAAWPEASEEERTRWMKRVERNQAELAHWAQNAPMNFLHRWRLVEAEKARVLDRPIQAMTLYEQAIRGAAEHRYLAEEAIANERCADLCRSLGWERAAETYLVEAHSAYLRWGAHAKVAALERQFPALLSSVGTTGKRLVNGHLSSTSSSGGAVLELSSMMKAAQAISGEIMLDRLVQSLLSIMVENAGAQRGLLLLDKDGQLVIKAEWAAGQSEVIERTETSIGESDGPLSSSIVHYAVRTGESVVLANATQAGLFTKDPYVIRHRPKSVLCAPLLNQGKLLAVIYLENNLTAGAFTADRLEVLQLLSGQAALSIHNATLYATLEHKVSERTRELREKNEELQRTQRQLVTQEKLASLGAVTAGIAHELKNPLNFVTNFAEITVELTQELSAELKLRSTEASETTDQLLGFIRQNAVKINEHGKRANQIIGGMLQLSHKTTGERTQTDLNALLAESCTLAIDGARLRNPSLKVDLQTEYDPTLGTIEAMAPDLGRVFLNMIGNAIYAVAQKRKLQPASDFSPRIQITTRRRGDRVEVRIRDNGTGIPQEIIDKIYMPFFTTKPPGEGTGLGLSISHGIIVDAHQGELKVESAEGEFTEFIITLPRKASRRR
ncbi:MAG: AAA family ATPase [Hyalangium sp.]|uniref:trifunctional serine/threonine-protein kinase/ATP-binding protein/sensor histidine kinase n=1 Tax=Hyalangium sp. TaxID=2028555 RepID=UPI0038998A8E